MLLLRLAWKGIKRNRMRATLAAASVAVGSASVPVAIMLGLGAEQKVLQTFDVTNLDAVYVVAADIFGYGKAREAGELQYSISEADVVVLRKILGKRWRPYPITVTRVSVNLGRKHYGAVLKAVESGWFSRSGWRVKVGRVFNEDEGGKAARVMVIGSRVAEEFFDRPDVAVGKILFVDSVPYTIVGVMRKRQEISLTDDKNRTVFVPSSSSKRDIFRLVNAGWLPLSSIEIYPETRASEEEQRAICGVVERTMKGLSKRAGKVPKFSVVTAKEFADAARTSAFQVLVLALLFSLIALFIGGVGVMNAMFAAVNERRWEIGVLVSIGAKPNQVVTQFILESSVICLFGGVVGSVIGYFLPKFVAAKVGWSFVFTPYALVIGIFAAASVGMLSGILPARAAAKMRPARVLLSS